MLSSYYEQDGITIYHGDARDVLPQIEGVDLIVTDPPYDGYEEQYEWNYVDLGLLPDTRAFVFWKGSEFPLPFTARHIWAKANRNIGKKGEQYEECYELNGSKTPLVMRHAVIDSKMNAQLNGDVFLNHPCQKPIKLMRRILSGVKAELVCDPFMGSGTTLRAAKDLRMRAVGIEIDERYCEMAAKRLQQMMLDFAG